MAKIKLTSQSHSVKQKAAGQHRIKSKANSKKNQSSAANKMWGGHFTNGPAELMAKINECIEIDKRLYAEDIAGSRAHADMLAKCGILSAKDNVAIKKGLTAILSEIENGKFIFKTELEDVHMNVEHRLSELIGEAAGRLHTARSRNDQIATDLRLWTRSAIQKSVALTLKLQKTLAQKALQHADTIMPGYTHLQPAQPITFGHHLLAYVEMLSRDAGRLMDAGKRMNEMPLGAAALAGTSYPIDRNYTAKALGFSAPMANSLDAVSARDFILEFMAAASILAVHLSRLAEEIIIWMSEGFKFIALPESFTTGSSIMPQKRNPDAAELIRAKSAACAGTFQQGLMAYKGLPLAYNKDFQEFKAPLVRCADELELILAVMDGMIDALQPLSENMAAATQKGFLTATDLADWLVQSLNIPFRQAHHITGQLVRMAEQKNCRLDELSLPELQKVEPRINKSVYIALNPQTAVDRRTSFGGTAPRNVRIAATKWLKQLSKPGKKQL